MSEQKIGTSPVPEDLQALYESACNGFQFANSAQATKALIERIAAAESALAQWPTWCIMEIAVRNPSVAEYMGHWEGRATKAEATVERLSAPVTDEEIRTVWEARKAIRGQGLCDYEAIGPVASAIIAARSTLQRRHRDPTP